MRACPVPNFKGRSQTAGALLLTRPCDQARPRFDCGSCSPWRAALQLLLLLHLLPHDDREGRRSAGGRGQRSVPNGAEQTERLNAHRAQQAGQGTWQMRIAPPPLAFLLCPSGQRAPRMHA